jgi:N-acetyl sugar amidotransferase
MDTTDSNIFFNEQGVCKHCINFDTKILKNWLPNEEGRKKLEQIVEDIKTNGKNKEYDCILGLSGGVDSSYLAYLANKVFGLRLLAVHVDCGWNSETAVKNIENIVKKLNIDLYTCVIDWEEMKDLQVAFLKSGLANQDTPQDHIIFSVLYNYAEKNNIKYVLHGSNYATESVLPDSWGYSAMDSRQLKDVHRIFGKVKLRKYKTVSFFKYNIYYPYILKMKVIRMLNFLDYNKDEAIKILEQELGWKYYGGKHYESRFTKLFQSYFLPKRFGYDKRRAHLSSLILSGQISRSNALEEINKEPYNDKELNEDINFVVKKLGMTKSEFETIMTMPKKTFTDYASNYSKFVFIKKLKQFIGKFI